MSSEDARFIRSVLPVNGDVRAAEAEDTSLALPEGAETDRSRQHLDDGFARVQQQVQFTMSRRSRKAPSHGNACSQDLTGTVAGRGFRYSAKVPSAFLHLGLGAVGQWSMKRPLQKVDMSPLNSPNFPHRASVEYGSFRCGTDPQGAQTLPSARAQQQYALSERVLSRRQQSIAGVSPRKQERLGNSPRESYRRHQRSLSAQQHVDGPMFQRVGMVPGSRQESYAASLVSMEMDRLAGQRMAQAVTKQQQASDLVLREWKRDGQGAVLTLEKAASLLGNRSVDTQFCAASCIQHECFSNPQARNRAFHLQCIPKLLELLQSDSEELQRVGTAALRNVVFQNDNNKMEVIKSQGTGVLLRLLKSNRDIETRKQLTGLLWNLSSHDGLKDTLATQMLKVLTDSVIIPCSGITEGDNPKDDLLTHPDIFYNATGCLRNLSSAEEDTRRAMRCCTGLIDALVHYVQGTIADHNPDDKSTENCICILHNLSYQVLAEMPETVKKSRSTQMSPALPTKAIGCFGSRSNDIVQRSESRLSLMEGDSSLQGACWLWSRIAVRMYLSLLARSNCTHTQEAATGAMCNITAGNSKVQRAMAHTIVEDENGLEPVKKILKEGKSDLKRAALSLVYNVSHYSQLHGRIVEQLLPQLIATLPDVGSKGDVPTETIVSVCHIFINLSRSDSKNTRAIANQGGLAKIISINSKENGSIRVSQATALLLHTMWKHKDLQAAFKKAGYRNDDFINSRTTKALDSLRDRVGLRGQPDDAVTTS